MRIALLVLALGSLGFASCGGGSDGTFDREGFPFQFQYPDAFEESDEVSIDQALGGEAEETVAIGLNDDNAIILQRFTLRIAVDESNLRLAQREIDGLMAQVDPDASSEPTEVAGLPALLIEKVDVPSIQGGESRLTILFDGDQEYVVNCQSTPEDRAEIEAACETALETLTLE